MDSEFFDDDIITKVDDDEVVIDRIETESVEKEPAETEDDKEYSKKVQQRIGKVVQQRNIERDRRLAIEQENAALREQLQKNQDQHTTESMAVLKQQKIDALEIGDHQTVADIDDKIMDYKAQGARQHAYQAPEQVQQLPKALTDWQQSNKWIFDDKNPKTVKANEIYAELLNEGFDQDDPDLFVEIDKKLKRQVPTPTSAPDRGQVVDQGGFTFTAQDKELMAEFGLDSNNKEHRKQWAISKKAAHNG